MVGGYRSVKRKMTLVRKKTSLLLKTFVRKIK